MARQTKKSKPEGVRYTRVSIPDIPKWDAKANRDLPDDLYYGGGSEFSFRNPVWINDVGHGAWDDEGPGPDEKNLASRWTCWPMTQYLRHRRLARLAASEAGEVQKFLGMVANHSMHCWPPVWELMFIDYKGHSRKLALQLIGVKDSPKGMPFPRMDKGFLDLGPDLALDGCELVILTQEMRDTFSQVLEQRRIRVKQWFPNNKRELTGGKGLKAILKTDIEKTRLPQAKHVYSRMLYAKRGLREKVVAEAARTGEPPNSIAVISRMTNAEWKKETPEVRAEVMSIQSEQKKQVVAVKAHRYDDIAFATQQKKQLFEAVTGWGFVVVGAGIDSGSENLRSCSWEYGTGLASGKEFFDSFDRDAAAGLRPSARSYAKYGTYVQQKPQEPVASSSSMDVDLVAHDVPKVAPGNNNSNLPPVNNLLPDESLPGEPPQETSSLDTVDEPLPDEPLPNEPPQGTSSADEPLPLLSSNRTPDLPVPSGSEMDVDSLLAAWNSGQLSMPNANSMYCQSSQNNSVSQNNALFFQSPQGSPVYDDYALLQLLHDNSFPVTNEFQPNIPAPSSSNNVWSDSFWNSYGHISPGPSLLNPTYSSYNSSQTESSTSSMAFTSSLSPSFVAPPSFPSTESSMSSMAFTSSSSVAPSSFPSTIMPSEDVEMSEVETISDLATKNKQQEPVQSNRASAEVHPRTLSNRSAEQVLAPVIPQQARNRKPPGPREVKTLIGSEQSTPVWQLQSLASMQDPTFSDNWAKLLDKWDALETILSKEKSSGKLQAPKKRPSVLAVWLDGIHSFSDLLSINDIDQFGDAMVMWWNSIQPNWRQSAEGLPLRKYDDSFMCLRKGGQNGIVTVIFGLFWWRKNLDDPSQWSALITDISDMFDALLNATGPEKRRIR
ncbi:uncharacterized protein EV420DRAFT_1643412 [Desarmillaria tabescens]|uniref:Uncharacterized protein n=1 Tax=Armillaria tabescens TaxID=1929756 RepID=A0AA39KDV5_ARMTA|nr:uncharacterized protein EV420DRAFT_1643412 [Desarmillaria tabescens]KAK0458066.1 hypothetical protein EV420DRAFT_1643412 [Desarmillaria tabescens]